MGPGPGAALIALVSAAMSGIESGSGAPATRISGEVVVREIAHFVRARARMFGGAAVLLAAVPLLLLGWRMVEAHRAERELGPRLTGRAEGRIAAHFWRLDVNPATAPAEGPLPLFYHARSEVWMTVELADPSGAAPHRLSYRVADRPPLAHHYATEVPKRPGTPMALPWADPERGWPRVEVRIPGPLAARLRASPASSWPVSYAEAEFAADRTPGDELAKLRIELDEPWEALARLWLRPPPEFRVAVAFDPERPERAVPVADLERLGTRPAAVTLLLAGLALGAGVVLYAMGMLGLLGGLRPLLAVPLALAGLLALPWWGDRASWFLERAIPGAGRFVSEIAASELEERLGDRLPRPEPAGDERFVYAPEEGFFAEVLAPFRLERPAPPPADPDQAWRALTAQLAEQALALPEREQRALLQRLVTDQRRDRRQAGEAFLPAADRLSRAAPSENVRAWARNLLLWQLRRLNDPDPDDFAAAAQRAAREALRDHPDADLRARAEESLGRLAER